MAPALRVAGKEPEVRQSVVVAVVVVVVIVIVC
jgi:hypothetical protein